ncbi:MAG: hypothetical protein F6K04_20675, partial [Leptolyngbya sp. SIO4C5]|nr:hypothetical protein [Leptolyngbya sp. SIO4C5]
MPDRSLEAQPSTQATQHNTQLDSRPFAAAAHARLPGNSLSPPTAPSAQAATDTQIQTQLERAKQVGFDPMQMSLFASDSPPTQPGRAQDSSTSVAPTPILQRQQAAPAPEADMTFTLEELEEAGAGQTEQPSLAEQFPDGISITLALQPRRSEIANHAARVQGMTWEQVLSRYQGRIGSNPRF